eukprot:jgi/Picsp_1/1827/NSC_05294-R1_zinc finger
MTESHYDTLNVPISCSEDRIKEAYRQALLSAHPDRKQAHTKDGDDDASSLCNDTRAAEKIERIQQAYRILKDARLRAEYDRELAMQVKFSVHQEGDCDIDLCDMEQENIGQGEYRYSYECRCGDTYQLQSSDLDPVPLDNSSDILVGCPSCSLLARIRLSK